MFRRVTDNYRAVMEMTRGCVVMLDVNGDILSCRSHMTTMPDSRFRELTGRNWFDVFLSVEGRDVSRDYFKRVILGKNADAHTILTRLEDDVFIDWSFMAVKETDTDGESQGVLGIGQDVTRHVRIKTDLLKETFEAKQESQKRQVELQHQLHHADRLATVGQLAAGIAHELNDPLGNILGYAQLASKQPDLPEQVYMDLDNIVRFALHAREIVKKVMLFSRRMPPQRTEVDLNKIVEDGLYFTEPLCSREGAKIECDLAADLPRIVADPSQLRQVIVNLLVNASQAMPDGGQIRVKTGIAGDDNTLLTVEDTGMGMDAETLAQCFNPFFTTKDVNQGTGLGLSVVHGIVKSHGGSIEAFSEPGKGARFDVRFPLADPIEKPNGN
jgi:PAS domain S-box-containing protein